MDGFWIALYKIRRIIDHMMININTETLCGSMRANTQSFNTTPFRFSIKAKKWGRKIEKTGINTIIAVNCMRLTREFQVSFHISSIDNFDIMTVRRN